MFDSQRPPFVKTRFLILTLTLTLTLTLVSLDEGATWVPVGDIHSDTTWLFDCSVAELSDGRVLMVTPLTLTPTQALALPAPESVAERRDGRMLERWSHA